MSIPRVVGRSENEVVFQLGTGIKFRISPVDEEFVQSQSWRCSNKYIAQSGLTGQYLHVLIAHRMGLGSSLDIDHRDRIKLNNRRDNLRLATRSQNNANSPKAHANSKSGYKGIYQHRNGRWRAQGTLNYEKIHLGYYDTAEAAYAAYQQWVAATFGEFSPI